MSRWTCPFCGLEQEQVAQTGENWGRGEGAFRCVRCREPQYTHEAFVLSVLRYTSGPGKRLTDATDPAWELLRKKLLSEGIDLESILVHVALDDGTLSGSLLSPDLKWYVFSLDSAGHCEVDELTMEGQAVGAARQYLEAFPT